MSRETYMTKRERNFVASALRLAAQSPTLCDEDRAELLRKAEMFQRATSVTYVDPVLNAFKDELSKHGDDVLARAKAEVVKATLGAPEPPIFRLAR